MPTQFTCMSLYLTENSPCTTAGTDVTMDSTFQRIGPSSNTKFIAVYTLPIKVPCNVDITAWDVRYSGPCDLAVQVWTSLNGRTDQFQLFGQNRAILPTQTTGTNAIGRINVSSSLRIHLTANQTYFFGFTSFGTGCFIKRSIGSHSVYYYATSGNLSRSVSNTLTGFTSTEMRKAVYLRAVLEGG